ncbi:MAG TPA: hypothetical protein VNN19_13390 [bacterium]|nr:hypothetical protein [bacterium]
MRKGVSAKIVAEQAGYHSVAFTLERCSWVRRDLQEVAVGP